MNKKVRHLGKRKTDSSARKCLRKLHTSEYKNSCLKKKLLFIPMKIRLITISRAIPYNSGMNNIRKSAKGEGKGEGKGEEIRGREEERVRTGGRRRRKRRRKKRKRKKRRKKRRK